MLAGEASHERYFRKFTSEYISRSKSSIISKRCMETFDSPSAECARNVIILKYQHKIHVNPSTTILGQDLGTGTDFRKVQYYHPQCGMASGRNVTVMLWWIFFNEDFLRGLNDTGVIASQRDSRDPGGKGGLGEIIISRGWIDWQVESEKGGGERVRGSNRPRCRGC